MALAWVGAGVIVSVVALGLLLMGQAHVLVYCALGAGIAALILGAAQWSTARHPRG